MSRAVTRYELHHALRQVRGAAGNLSRAKSRYARNAIMSARLSMLLVRLHREERELCALLDSAQATKKTTRRAA